MLLTEREARVALVIEDQRLERRRRLVASRAVGRACPARGADGAELTRVRIGMTVGAARAARALPGAPVHVGCELWGVACGAGRIAVGTGQREARPLAVVEAVLEGAERGLDVTARTVGAAGDRARSARAIEAPVVRIGVAGHAAREGPELRSHRAEGPARGVFRMRARMTGLARRLGVRTADGEARIARVVEARCEGLGERGGLVAARAVRGLACGGEEACVRVGVAACTRGRRPRERARSVLLRPLVTLLAGRLRVPVKERHGRARVVIEREPVRLEMGALVAADAAGGGERSDVELSSVRIRRHGGLRGRLT